VKAPVVTRKAQNRVLSPAVAAKKSFTKVWIETKGVIQQEGKASNVGGQT
jgi:hypothetical protein